MYEITHCRPVDSVVDCQELFLFLRYLITYTITFVGTAPFGGRKHNFTVDRLTDTAHGRRMSPSLATEHNTIHNE